MRTNRKVQDKTSRRDGRRAPRDVLPAAHAKVVTDIGRLAEQAHRLGLGRTAHVLRETLASAALDLADLVSKNTQEIRSLVEQAASALDTRAPVGPRRTVKT